MRNINKAIISGHLTREPELKRTQTGFQILSLGVAVNDSRKNQSTGEWEEYANYIDCVMLGERAEKIASMLHKGQKVCIEGKLRWSQWERDGKKRSKIEIIVDQIEFMSARTEQQPSEEQKQDAGVYDSDIPF